MLPCILFLFLYKSILLHLLAFLLFFMRYACVCVHVCINNIFIFGLVYVLNTISIISTNHYVTGQHGNWPLVTMHTHYRKICGEGNRFLLTGFPMWGAGGILAQSQLSQPLPQRIENQPAPQRLKSRSMPRSSPLLLICSPRLLLKRVSISLAPGSLFGARVAIASQQLSFSLSQGLGCAARSLQMVIRGKLHSPEFCSSCLHVLLSVSVCCS